MKNFSVIFDQRDVVIAEFPFTDMPIGKRRPVLVLSKRDPFNQTTNQIVCAMITGARKSSWPFDTLITDLEASGVRGPCVVRLKIFTLDQKMIDARCGVMAEVDFRLVLSRFTEMMGVDLLT